MDYKLKGKRALVTGSSKTVGIGRATANQLAAEGAHVILHGRSKEALEPALESLPSASMVIGDLSNQAGMDDVISQVEAIGPVDILVNNAATFETKDFFDIPYDEWVYFFETNVMSGVWLSRALMPGMLKRDWGRILFIASESAVNIPVEMIHYGMTKTAQLAISRGLSEKTKGTNVTVNAVMPGPTMTDGVDIFLDDFAQTEGIEKDKFVNETFFREARPSSLLQRFTTPEEVAHMIVYLCSPLSSATNGSALRVDGGVVKTAF